MYFHCITTLSILLVSVLLLLSTPSASAQTTCELATNKSTSNDTSNSPGMLVGIVLTIIPTLCYGSNYVPVKKFETGDGVFFQWVMSVAILIGGLITYGIQQFPRFYIEAAIGGAIWSLGNVCVVPIIKLLGLSVGFLIWAITSMVVGWATSTFGMFGIDKKVLCYPIMNYVGVLVCIIGGFLIAFVKPTLKKQETQKNRERTPLLGDPEDKQPNSSSTSIPYKTINADVRAIDKSNEDDLACIESLHPIFRKILGVSLGFMSGTFYGFMFLPISIMTTLSHNNTYYSADSLDYAFPYTTGIFLMATLILVVYSIVKLNKPSIYPQALLPGIISGGIWATGTMVWIYVNGIVSTSISYPLVSSGPPIISSIWGILVFREIQGKVNLILFLSAFVFILCGILLVTLSDFKL
ncbi:putative membrane protein [Oopsacas minuta]|uniref:Membrane protein n=1 Tax=Oopsacas minuta TaxID=111878 RepID=A0AAV7K106_9METZ|nr:putative membrane protein [Oopsacas minuta]